MLTRASVWAGKRTSQQPAALARAQYVARGSAARMGSRPEAAREQVRDTRRRRVRGSPSPPASARAPHSTGAQRVETARAAVRWLLPLLSAPAARTQLRSVCVEKDGGALNEHVGGTAKLQLLFGMLLAVGTLAF